MPVHDTRVTMLADGRNLAWTDLGDPDGVPVFAFHGTPGSRLQLAFADEPARAAGVRLLVPDRPGYGLSTYHPRPSFTGWVGDVARLADHLGVSRFAVIGISGGGPYVAACAALLPDRVMAGGIVSGVAPLADPGSEAGMTATDVVLFRVMRRTPSLTLPAFALLGILGRRLPERVIDLMKRNLAAADAAVLTRPDARAALIADLRGSARTTGRALWQEYTLFARDWGFHLEDVTVPLHLWHGDADLDVPIAHAHRLAEAIPGAVLHECPGEGHLLVISRLEEILSAVTAAR